MKNSYSMEFFYCTVHFWFCITTYLTKFATSRHLLLLLRVSNGFNYETNCRFTAAVPGL